MLVHHKLEAALLAYVTARLTITGLTIVAGHGNLTPAVPALSIWAGNADPHPDFVACGRGFPEVVLVSFGFMAVAKAAGFNASIAIWLDQLDTILCAPAEGSSHDYSALMAYLNPPASGPDERPIPDLYVYHIEPGHSADAIGAQTWDGALTLEFTAQNGDPTP